ncbi:hypothetical protein ACFQO9_09440 [Chryseobacterium zhengzhouense]|uniref:YD repeat-containing protein n=1 Tax=Chryseobacterium zhengzhouense TaxID=1636086 RepID=A0ABW2LWN0_9FLAO
MMKKIPILLSVAIGHLYFGQNLQEGFSKPEASVASLSTYVNTPVSYATGIPNISFPLATLPTHSKDVNINIALSYHPGTMFSDDRASEAGLGWTVLGSNAVISREIIAGTDERFYTAGAGNYTKNPFDDIYYYNFGGESGKFRFIRDTVNNTFQVVKLTPSNVKIEYVREPNNATLLLQSFKMTDDKGNIYLFDVNGRAANKYGSVAGVYKSAFYLTKAYNCKMQELYSVEYQIENKSAPQAYPQDISLQTCKVKKITSRDYGTIDFEYVKETVMPEAFNDPYRLNSMTVKNKAGDIINTYSFVYNTLYNSIIPGKRTLSEIKKTNRTLSETETTAFEYNTTGSPKNYGPVPGKFKDYFVCDDEVMHFDDPKYFSFGTLKKVKLPTGGAVEYNFEPKEYAMDDLNNYIAQNISNTLLDHPQFQYLKPVANINFDTRLSSQFNFTTSPGAATYVRFRKLETYPHPFDPNIDPGLDYSITSASGVSYTGDLLCINDADLITTKKYYTDNSNYMLKILSPTGGRGTIEIYEIATKAPPYKNAITDRSLRIESIKYFENASTATPAKTETFVYDRFDDANTSSGDPFYINIGNGEAISNPIYKNVKVLNGDYGGYTKYYYKTPSDFPDPNLGGSKDQFWPHLNITRSGLLSKKEVYSAQNVLQISEEHTYNLQSIGNEFYRVEGYPTLTSFIKYHTTTSKIFDSGQYPLVTKSEISFSETNGLTLEMQKTTHSDNSITETRYKYPQDTNHTSLIAANMVTVPLQIETKKNGTVISKTETKFEDATHFYPTSQISFLPDNLNQSIKNASYDIYDDKGNPVQITSFPDVGSEGVSTTIIYGYNKTLPIAKIQGAKLSDIPSNLITAIVNASNEDANATAAQEDSKEQTLIAALNTFKNDPALRNFMITCYTYNPLIGITTTIPPNGLMEFYKYDAFNRLLKVVDVNGNTVKEHLYNYKN